jgi:hypothetical protein
MRYLKGFIFSLLVIASISAAAQTRHESEPYCDHKSAGKLQIADADAIIIGLGIGQASLQDVQAKLGRAKITRVSRDEESDVSVCYVSPTDGTVLVFYSGAMGGWTEITRFAVWSRAAAFPHASQCTPSKLVSWNIAAESGLHLGPTRQEIEKIAGKPRTSAPASAKYEYVCRRKMTEAEIKSWKTGPNNWDVTKDPYFDRMSWMDVPYMESAASRIEIGKIESY